MKKVLMFFGRCIDSIKSSLIKGAHIHSKDDIQTQGRTYSLMPKTFDFTAYFEEIELENTPNDSAAEILLKEVNADIICKETEKYANNFFLTENQGLECCIN